MVVRDGRTLADAVPRHRLARLLPAARRACSRSRSRRTTRMSGLFYVYSTDRDGGAATSSSSARSREREPRRPGQARGRCCACRTSSANHNGGLLLFGPDGLPLHRDRRRRRRGRPAWPRKRAGPQRRCSASSCASTPHRAARRLHDPAPTIRSVGRSRGARARSTPTGCATRGGSRSTGATGDLRSATSARTRTRRSTSCVAGKRAGANSRLAAVGGAADASSN